MRALLLALCCLNACTDWQARSGAAPPGPQLNGSTPAGAGADAAAGLVGWETWQPPPADVSTVAPDLDAGVTPGEDVSMVALDADAGSAADAPLSVDAGSPPPECTGDKRALGCSCSWSSQCASGLCTLGPDGTVCSQSCEGQACPAGWSCAPPANVCKPPPLPDAGPAASDAGALDDASDVQPSPPDVQPGPSDALTTPDDVVSGDAAFDAGLPLGDGSGLIDVLTDSGALTDAGALTDSGGLPSDSGTPPSDGGSSSADVGFTDAGSAPDWQGYGDYTFSTESDAFSGPLASCLNVYLFQQETCGKTGASPTCIDQVASAGSAYASFLFAPLADCEKTMCANACPGAVDDTCWNQCVVKYCANQFLACVANDAVGTSDCTTAMACAAQYPGKLLSIASLCYAKASSTAQKQMAAVLGCATAPQTKACVGELGACYGVAGATGSCQALLSCLGQSGVLDCTAGGACAGCLQQASATAVQQLQALADCRLAQCPALADGSPLLNACLQAKCAAQVQGCAGP
jgi:hypothetical protein